MSSIEIIMKVKSIKNFSMLITLIILFSLIYFYAAASLLTICYNSGSLLLLKEIIEEYSPPPISFYPKLIIVFLIGFDLIILSIIAWAFYPGFFKRHISIIVSVAIFCAVSCQLLFNGPVIGFIFLVILLALESLQSYNAKDNWPPLTRPIINLPKWFCLLGLILFSSLLFFLKFPLARFNNLIFEDDYIKYFYFAKYQLNMLSHQALFGWNDSFAGGYPSFLDLRLLGVLFLPFAVLGDYIGFHTMIYAFYVSLPLLIYWLSWQLTACEKISILNGVICSFAMLAYSGDMLRWGLLPGLFCIAFFVLNLVFLEKFLKGKKFSLFLLGLGLGLMFYVHLITFAFSICFFSIRVMAEKFIFKNRIPIKKIGFVCLFIFLICLPLLYLLLQYRNYIIPTYLFSKQNIIESLADNFITILRCLPVLPVWLLNCEYFRALWMTLPIAVLCLLFDNRAKKSSLYFIIFFLFTLSAPTIYYILASEVKYSTPVFISLISGVWIVNRYKRISFPRFIIILLICSYMIKIDSLNKPIKYIDSVFAFNPVLTDKIKRLDGGIILLENIAHLSPYKNLTNVFVRPDYPHLEGVLELSTGKEFLSHCGEDPYPYFKFREGIITNGVFMGENIQSADIKDVTQILKKWGIKYAVLWSQESVKYFSNYRQYFENIFYSDGFSIFRFKDTDGRKVSLGKGRGIILTLSPFRKTLFLHNAVKGELVTIRMNYFPAWKAFYAKEAIKLFKNDGQISLFCPSNGNLKIDLYFPKYTFLLVISLFSILYCFLLSIKGSI